MKGVYFANPILLMNMGCEMIYIIDQRLKAQQIDPSKATIVLSDLIMTLFSEKQLPNLYKPTKLYKKDFINQYFHNLAHCSIMKLNKESMGKLLDLVIMHTKLNMLQSNSPYEIYLITLQHFEEIDKFQIDDQCRQALYSSKDHFISTYIKFTFFDFYSIRCEIMKYLTQRMTRVAIFLNEGSQNQDGSFKLSIQRLSGYKIDKPGKVKVFLEKSPDHTFFTTLESIKLFNENNSTDPFTGFTDLGGNIYLFTKSNPKSEIIQQQEKVKVTELEKANQTEQLNQLAKFIQPTTIKDEKIEMFKKETGLLQFDEEVELEGDHQFIPIQLEQNKSNKMKEKILEMFQGMEEQQNIVEEDNDLLNLMDQL